MDDLDAINTDVTLLWRYAVELKKAGYSFYDFNGTNLSSELRHKALQLHYYSTFIMVSTDGTDVDANFVPENARKLVSAGNPSYTEFVEKLKKFDLPIKCNCIWDENAVAYRCYTCGKNPCMSICVDCFEAGDHIGHDCNRFFSSSGGKCDCGDPDVVLESGFCHKHGKRNNPAIEIPIELTAMVEFMMYKISAKIIEKFRGYEKYAASRMEYRLNIQCTSEFISERALKEVDPLITFLDELIGLSAPCIDIMAGILSNEDFYAKLCDYDAIKSLSDDFVINIEEMDRANSKSIEFLEDVKLFRSHAVPKSLSSVEFLQKERLKFDCLLDEFMFYQIKLGFPQSLINVLLKLLPNDEFKNRFAINFFGHYDQIESLIHNVVSEEGKKAINTHTPSKIISRVVHITVQICSSKAMCLMLESKVNILRRVMESCLRFVYDHASPFNTIFDNFSPSTWYSLDMQKNVFFENCGYTGATTDLQNLFAHFDLLSLVFTDPLTSKQFVWLICGFEGMNLLTRIVYGNHIERDGVDAQRCFSFEIEISGTFINQLLFADPTRSYPTETYYIDCLIEKLMEFFEVVFSNQLLNLLSSNYVTFHIPLHRQLATSCMKYFMANKTFALPDDVDFLKSLVAHPLRLQAAVSEFFAGMWTRNGSMMNTNVIFYLQPTFRTFLDSDLSLIRIVATKLPPFEIVDLMYDAFHLIDCFKYNCSEYEGDKAPANVVIFNKKWVSFMIDGYLKMLFELVFVQSLAEISMEKELRFQITHVLSVFDKATYSKIRQYFNYIPQIDEKLFDKTLQEIAQFVKPDAVGTSNQQGYYMLKAEAWTNELNLIQAKYRSISPREFQSILIHQEKIFSKMIGTDRKPWPYYCLDVFDKDDFIFKETLSLLVQPANILVCRFILEWYLNGDFPVILAQQAIYLLNLILKLATLPIMDEVEIQFVDFNDEYNKSSWTCLFNKSSREEYFKYFNEAPLRTLYLKATECKSILMLAIKMFFTLYSTEYPKSQKVQAAQEIEKMCNSNLEKMNRVVGSGTDYVGRLIAWLYHCDPVSQQIINKEVFSLIDSRERSSSISDSQRLMEKKIAAKKRQLELLNQQKAKQSALMKKFAIEEGMHEEGDKMECEPSELIHCSICNEACNEGQQNLFGVMIYAQTGSVIEDSITAKTNGLAIGKTKMETIEKPTEGALMASYRDFEREAISAFQKVYPDPSVVFSLLPYMELKTCVHYAHLDCYEKYRETVKADEYGRHALHALPCPLCRMNVSYILPLASKLEMTESFIDFDNFFSSDSSIQIIVKRHLSFEKMTGFFHTIQSSHYDKLKTKIKRMIIERETMIPLGESIVAPHVIIHVYENNPAILPLSIIKNYIDRIVEIEANDYVVPSRLRGNLIEHLYYMACIESIKAKKSGTFFANIWLQIYAENSLITSNKIPPLLHYDSTSLLVICNTSMTSLDLPSAQRIELFRACVKISLVHCFIRTIVISLLNRPSHLRKPLLDSLSKYIDGEAISHFVNGTLINHAKYWRNSPIEVSTDVINNQLQMKLVKFLEFSLNLGVELQLVQKVEKNKDITFDEQFNIYSEALFGQNMQLCNIVNLINGPVRRIDNWIEDFLQTPDELSVCYMDNMWFMKKLLKLPDSFDNLFKCYFNQKCIECESVPNQPFICLICGRLLCLDECCAEKLEMDTQDKISEVESHANLCCSGSACFMSLTSTMIIIYHRRYITLFQSPYLDKHFEEDRNLRRGKSLFLSEARYHKLEELWITHDFERKLAWHFIPIEELDNILRRCHMF